LVHSITDAEEIQLLEKMVLIREVELEISRRYGQGKMRCPTHLSVGQESTPAILDLYLRDTDFAVSTHRSHAHYIAKGGNLFAMLAEIYGLDEGCSKGRGGSMHLVDKKVGFMGSSAIVGNSIPIGTGLGLTQKLDSQDGISVVYIGDAAVEEGVFFESANFAAARKIPVLYVCENNGYSVYSGIHGRQPENRTIKSLAEGLGLQAAQAKFAELDSSISVIAAAVEHCRITREPYFIEVESERYLEHCGPNNDDHLGYRDLEHLKMRKLRDPIDQLSRRLQVKNVDTGSIFHRTKDFVEREFAAVEKLYALNGSESFGGPS
jgi:TPP-dependent pyruvate/acetoin dehydrogenase alpha subunit